MGFPVVLYSDDTIQLGSKALLDSPRLEPSELVFVNVDYSLESDQLDWSIGIPISRSGSIESLNFDPNTIFFDKLDEYKEYPGAKTPTRISSNHVEHPNMVDVEPIEALEEVNEEAEPDAVVSEDVIDRDALIQSIIKNLEKKDKLTSKNIAFQNKLADYFKKKRVCWFFIYIFRVTITETLKKVGQIKKPVIKI